MARQIAGHDSASEHVDVKYHENVYFLYIKAHFNMLFSSAHLWRIITFAKKVKFGAFVNERC